MTGTMHSLQQLVCGLRGHDEVLCFERRRLALKCLNCGHESAGWTLLGENHHPQRTAPSPPRRLAHGNSLAPSVHSVRARLSPDFDSRDFAGSDRRGESYGS